DHSYCLWEKLAGTTTVACKLYNVTYLATGAPQASSPRYPFLFGCPADFRIAPGPARADSTMIVTSAPSSPSSIATLYAVSTGNVSQSITNMGSAAKIRFDGKRFWVAWLDPATALRLTSLELNGTVIQYTLPDWTPAGPEAFELVGN